MIAGLALLAAVSCRNDPGVDASPELRDTSAPTSETSDTSMPSEAPDSASDTSAATATTATTAYTGDTSSLEHTGDSGEPNEQAVPFPSQCSHPDGLDIELPGDTAIDKVPVSASWGGVTVSVKEGSPGTPDLGDTLTIGFYEYLEYQDDSVVQSPYTGVDDCVVLAPHATTTVTAARGAGTVTVTLSGQTFEQEPVGSFASYAGALLAGEGILPENLWGQTFALTVAGDQAPSFEISDAPLPSGPLALTEPRRGDVLQKDAVTLRWTPGPAGAPPLRVDMSFAESDANVIQCWVEDDGEWTVPAEVWEPQNGSFPTSGVVQLKRLEHCWFEAGPDQYVYARSETEASAWIQVTE